MTIIMLCKKAEGYVIDEYCNLEFVEKFCKK